MTKKQMTRDERILACFRTDTLDDLIFWAFRYFLGRMTIATTCFAKDLAKAAPLLSVKVRYLLRRELEETVERDTKYRLNDDKGYYDHAPLGRDCDRDAWGEALTSLRACVCIECAKALDECTCHTKESI